MRARISASSASARLAAVALAGLVPIIVAEAAYAQSVVPITVTESQQVTDSVPNFVLVPPPSAVNDTYSDTQDMDLNVPGPSGVLANDISPSGGTLRAVLQNNPTNGTVTLNADGSFTYKPNTGFTGVDSFTYRAQVGAAQSNIAVVTVNVLANANNTGPGGTGAGGTPGATPELDSLVLLGSGLVGLAGYGLARLRGRRR